MVDFDILTEIRRRALSALTPPRQMALSQWIEAAIVLPSGLAAVPAMRLYPYQAAIADAIGDPDLERVTLQKAARIGFSVLVAAAIGHFTTNDPLPVICLLPVESDCRDFVASDREPLFEASPALAGDLARRHAHRPAWQEPFNHALAVFSGRKPSRCRGKSTTQPSRKNRAGFVH
jgi:phage terminase large subunit GpA-like protein